MGGALKRTHTYYIDRKDLNVEGRKLLSRLLTFFAESGIAYSGNSSGVVELRMSAETQKELPNEIIRILEHLLNKGDLVGGWILDKDGGRGFYGGERYGFTKEEWRVLEHMGVFYDGDEEDWWIRKTELRSVMQSLNITRDKAKELVMAYLGLLNEGKIKRGV